jgi:hypothetical protein
MRWWLELFLFPVDSDTCSTDVTYLGLRMSLFALGILMFCCIDDALLVDSAHVFSPVDEC